MPKKYQITIPNHCQEDWNEMKPTGLGRFCNNCERNIQDYSSMNDNQLVQLLLSDQPHCGYFDASQLNRVLQMDRRNVLPTLNLRAVAMGFGILVSTTSLAARSYENNASIHLIEVLNGTSSFTYLDVSSDVDEFCHFIVMDAENNYLAGAKLQLLDDRGHVADEIETDRNGMARYDRMMIQEMRIREIRVIPQSKDYQRTTVAFQGAERTDHNVIQVEAKPQKPAKVPRRYRRRKRVMGVMAYGHKF